MKSSTLVQQNGVACFFEMPPYRSIDQIIPSPDWNHYLVVYSPDERGAGFRGNDVAMYSLKDGKLWYIAGDELPRNVGYFDWFDADTIYAYSDGAFGDEFPARVYGIDYDVTGLPSCLVEAFPEDYTRWLDLWERLNARLRSDDLGLLALRLCAVLPATVEEVEIAMTPTAVPTVITFSTPPPSIIAGVPACLTTRFNQEALAYAEDWREITADLSEEEVAVMAELLCEGLGGASGGAPSRGLRGSGSSAQVMTIDVRTGARSLGSYVPAIPQRERPLQPIVDEFRRTQRFSPDGAILSPDGKLLASVTSRGQIAIYRLPNAYEDMIATLTATAAGVQPTATANLIRLRPTATPGFIAVGQSRPTLTPTITPTSPPAATQIVDLPQLNQVEEICPVDTLLYTVENPPPEYGADGRLLVYLWDERGLWILEPEDGRFFYDETLLQCDTGLNCEFSFDRDWVLYVTDQVVVSRPDGSQARVLFRPEEHPAWPGRVDWIDRNTLEYRYTIHDLDNRGREIAMIQHIIPGETPDPEPFRVPDRSVHINEFNTDVLSWQPDGGAIAMARTSFSVGDGSIGYKYYMVDADTGDAEYFARLVGRGTGEMQTVWHPLGHSLYYRYPGVDEWHIYDATTREHRLLGELPSGSWSRDGRYLITWFSLPGEEREERREEGLPLPNIRIWDSATGLTRTYCVPQTYGGSFSSPFTWSPDNRYVLFLLTLPDEAARDTDRGSRSVVRPHTLILDTQSGNVTDAGFDVTNVIAWMTDADIQGGKP